MFSVAARFCRQNFLIALVDSCGGGSHKAALNTIRILMERPCWLIGCLSAQSPQSRQHFAKHVTSRLEMGT